jgi:8-oxo-dGTP diphosphatase
MQSTATRPRKLVVAGLIRDEKRRVLLGRRRPDQPMPNQWELPGGKVEPGESPVDALRRELQEELGCDAEVGRIDDVVFFAYPEFDLYMLVYRVELRGEPRAVEVAAIAWVEPRELPSWDLLPADKPLAERLAREG